MNAIAFGLGYQTFLTDRFGIEGQFLYSPYFSISYDDPGQQTSLDFNTNTQSIPFFVRILLNYKTGKESNLNFGSSISLFTSDSSIEKLFKCISYNIQRTI